MKYIKIEWIDSGTHIDPNKWAPLSAYTDVKPTTVVTAGLFMHEDNDAIWVGLSYDPFHDAWYGAQWIYKDSIVDRVELEL